VCWKAKLDAWGQRRLAEVKREHPEAMAVACRLNYKARQLHQGLTDIEWGSDYSRCKKGDTGAVPGVIVAGTGIGERVWLRGTRSDAGRSTSAGGAVPLETKRLRLACKRGDMVLALTAEGLAEVDTPKTRDLIAMGLCFGVETTHFSAAPMQWQAYAAACELHEDMQDDLEDRLWAEQVRPVLMRRLMPDKHYQRRPLTEAVAVCGEFGLPYETYVAAAKGKFRVPKSWVTDGEPLEVHEAALAGIFAEWEGKGERETPGGLDAGTPGEEEELNMDEEDGQDGA